MDAWTIVSTPGANILVFREELDATLSIDEHEVLRMTVKDGTREVIYAKEANDLW